MSERHTSNSVLQLAGAFSLREAGHSAGQLAPIGALKHRAVGMAAKENFPPNSAQLHRTDKEKGSPMQAGSCRQGNGG